MCLRVLAIQCLCGAHAVKINVEKYVYTDIHIHTYIYTRRRDNHFFVSSLLPPASTCYFPVVAHICAFVTVLLTLGRRLVQLWQLEDEDNSEL